MHWADPTFVQMTFWLGAACVGYVYVAYPMIIALAAYLQRRPSGPVEPFTGSVSLVLVLHNEERLVERRLKELKGLAASLGDRAEIVVVSDGSTDRTTQVARMHADRLVKVLELPVNQGKASALSAGCEAATCDVLVFADARQHWAVDALAELLKCFGEPDVGAVSGELMIETDGGLLSGVGLYWRYEKWLRRNESCLHSTVGVSGSISAVRRELFKPIPQGTILDDVYWPLQVVMQGFRVVHAERAIAHDRLPTRVRDEFRRKVRTLAGNFQLLGRLPKALVPWRNPIWVQFVSHKLMRLLVPWALMLTLIASALLPGRAFSIVLWGQLGFYSAGLIGILVAGKRKLPVLSAIGSFVVLNAAAWVAFWVWLSGRAERSWQKTEYGDLRP